MYTYTSNMTAIAANIVTVNANATGVLGDDGALLEGVEDALDGVVTHRDQKTARKLRIARARVEQRGRGVNEPLLGHEIVGLDGAVDVGAVYSHAHAHEQMLRPLHRLAVDLEQVGLLEGLEAEIVVVEVAVVDDGGVEAVRVGPDDFAQLRRDQGLGAAVARIHRVVQVLDHVAEHLLGLLVQVGDGDARRQNRIVRMLGGHGGGRLRRQVVQLDGGHARIEAVDHLLCDLSLSILHVCALEKFYI